MADPEARLISAVLVTNDWQSAQGIEPVHMASYPDEWEWLTRYVAEYGRTPSVAAFRDTWPEVRLVKVHDVEHYAREVLRAWEEREAITLAHEIADAVAEGQPTDHVIELVQTYTKRVRAGHPTANEIELFTDWGEMLAEAKKVAAAVASNGIAGIPFGFPLLDHLTGGMRGGEVFVIGARPGNGKTFTALHVAHTALKAKRNVLLFSLEMSRRAVGQRMHQLLSADTDRPFTDEQLRLGQGLDLTAYHQWLKAMEENDTKLWIVDSTRGSVGSWQVAQAVERLQPDLVIIDYFSLMKHGGGKNRDPWVGLAELSGEMKSLAVQHDIPTVLLNQINREGEVRPFDVNVRPPSLNNLSGTDALGQDADGLITIVQVSPRVLKMRLAKYRPGSAQQMWFVRFEPGKGIIEETDVVTATRLVQQDRELSS